MKQQETFTILWGTKSFIAKKGDILVIPKLNVNINDKVYLPHLHIINNLNINTFIFKKPSSSHFIYGEVVQNIKGPKLILTKGTPRNHDDKRKYTINPVTFLKIKGLKNIDSLNLNNKINYSNLTSLYSYTNTKKLLPSIKTYTNIAKKKSNVQHFLLSKNNLKKLETL
jgi:ribosomal protein L21